MLRIPDERVPLTADPSGVIYVAGTRVTLECIVELFEDNASPEEIVEQYDVLQLADVYAVITYMLRHRDEVSAYLAGRRAGSEERWQAWDKRFPPTLRSKLMAGRRGPSSSGS